MVGEMHRWKRLEMSFIPGIVDLSFLSGSANSLLSIKLRGRDAEKDRYVLQHWPNTSALVEVTLNRVSLADWTILYNRRLTSLSLVEVSNPYVRPSLINVLDILRGSPTLQELDIRHVAIPIEDSSTSEQIPTILLPHLRRLTIQWLTHWVTVRILDAIATPRCHEYTFGSHYLPVGGDQLPPVDSVIAQVLPAYRNFMAQAPCRNITIHLDRSLMKMQVDEGFSFEVHRDYWAENELCPVIDSLMNSASGQIAHLSVTLGHREWRSLQPATDFLRSGEPAEQIYFKGDVPTAVNVYRWPLTLLGDPPSGENSHG